MPEMEKAFRVDADSRMDLLTGAPPPLTPLPRPLLRVLRGEVGSEEEDPAMAEDLG